MDSKIVDTSPRLSGLFSVGCEPQTLELYAYCYEDRFEIMPQLTVAFVRCGGWILERHTISASSTEYRFEIQLSGVIDLYGALLALGVELTRDAHATLTDLCTCHKHARLSTSTSQVLTFRLEVQFLSDLTLHSLLSTGHGNA